MATKHQTILNEIRSRIVEGRLKLGELMPSRLELSDEFGVSTLTLQRVFDQLREDGFITARPRAGTFVSEAPPFLTDYALVFPSSPNDHDWSRFYEGLYQEAMRITREGSANIKLYYGSEHAAESSDYVRLREDCQAHRLCGEIFATVNAAISDTDLLMNDIPGVVLTTTEMHTDHRGELLLDYANLWKRAADYFVDHGCKTIAVLSDGKDAKSQPDKVLSDTFKAVGLIMPADCQITLSSFVPQGATHWIAAMAARDFSKLPDGLFVTDDNFAESVIRGLVMAGVRVPDDIRVLSHNNFPMPLTDVLPIDLLGFDARHILKNAMRHIQACRRGEKPSNLVRIDPVFQNEI